MVSTFIDIKHERKFQSKSRRFEISFRKADKKKLKCFIYFIIENK